MGFLSSLNIAASGLTAQRQRLDVVSENITNLNTTRTEKGGPYRRKLVVFQATGAENSRGFKGVLNKKMNKGSVPNTPGVVVTKIIEDEAPFNPVYNPEHPDADESGYVMMPNVDLIKETVDGMAATRAYEANITTVNAIKLMAQKALEIGK
ncbi:MAG: flagellar basal body rod protein FlgC [Oscillospiraceae bacterium]|nr:flagellar basal body rod protein FlgC [Oscillospiraceae bacterium]